MDCEVGPDNAPQQVLGFCRRQPGLPECRSDSTQTAPSAPIFGPRSSHGFLSLWSTWHFRGLSECSQRVRTPFGLASSAQHSYFGVYHVLGVPIVFPSLQSSIPRVVFGSEGVLTHKPTVRVTASSRDAHRRGGAGGAASGPQAREWSLIARPAWCFPQTLCARLALVGLTRSPPEWKCFPEGVGPDHLKDTVGLTAA